MGVVTLVMACVFATGWVRSRFSEDKLLWKSDVVVAFVVSIDSTLMIWGGTYDEPFQNWLWPVFETKAFRSLEELPILWRFNLAGIRIAKYESMPPVTGYVVALPYHLIVIPLTLLSSYLLLSKPRVANPKPDESLPEKVA